MRQLVPMMLLHITYSDRHHSLADWQALKLSTAEMSEQANIYEGVMRPERNGVASIVISDHVLLAVLAWNPALHVATQWPPEPVSSFRLLLVIPIFIGKRKNSDRFNQIMLKKSCLSMQVWYHCDNWECGQCSDALSNYQSTFWTAKRASVINGPIGWWTKRNVIWWPLTKTYECKRPSRFPHLERTSA